MFFALICLSHNLLLILLLDTFSMLEDLSLMLIANVDHCR